jgi:probable DNA metabolism protein
MITLLYDSSLEGFLTAIFEAYERKLSVYRIRKEDNYADEMFSSAIPIETDKGKSGRVWNGLRKKMTNIGLDYLSSAFLSELPEMEDLMQAFIQHIFRQVKNAERDFSCDAVLRIQRISKMVHRERHRMKAFIRFQLTKDGIYYAAIEPDYNVIPLIITHFKNRYADQRWLIYDLRRKYGIYYDLSKVETITLEFTPGNQGGRHITISFDEKEHLYQRLWQDYFKSVNIQSRKNMSLHLRHVPRRYWKLLTEKLQ